MGEEKALPLSIFKKRKWGEMVLAFPSFSKYELGIISVVKIMTNGG